jgi:multimeric flavodoxin WrbA
MNKKYLIIKGSGRENGYTNKLCNVLAEHLSGDEVEFFDTHNEKIIPCNGCDYCRFSGVCINRDLDAFYKSFEECDTVIFFSPVYNGTFPAPMKSLIDRFQVYYSSFYENNKTQPIEKKRTAYLIGAAGRDGAIAFDYMKGQLKCAFTILNIELKDAFLCSNTDTQPDFDGVLQQIKRSLSLDDER